MKRQPRGRNIDVLLEERRERRLSRILTILGSLLGAAAAVYLGFIWYEERQRDDSPENRVVVVPFDNRTGDPALDYLGLVTSDWLTLSLTFLLPGRQIVPTTTVLAYSNSARLSRFDPLTRARLLGPGTRAHTVVFGSYYRSGDLLRFHINVQDLEADTAWTSMPEVETWLSTPMIGVEAAREAVADRLVTTRFGAPVPRFSVPDERSYAMFIEGLKAYAQRRYNVAASFFGRVRDSRSLQMRGLFMESLVRSRQYQRADSLAHVRVRHVFTGARGGYERLRRFRALQDNDLALAHRHAWYVTLRNPADDAARFDFAVSALSVNRPREARTLFRNMFPNRGALHGRPEYYLHYAAAYHMLGNHRAEMRVIRDGQRARERSLDVRLAYCRVRAAGEDRAAAMSALNALTYADIDTSHASIPIPAALEDCGAELDAHGFPDLAAHAGNLARAWRRGEPRTRFVPDSVYEPGYVLYERARREAEAGQIDDANATLEEALESGLPFYEPGRVMLHSEPAFRRLRNTRAFLQLNQPQG